MYCARLGRRAARRVERYGEGCVRCEDQQKQGLSRQDAARFIAALAEGLGDDGRVTVWLGGSTLEFTAADQMDCEFEVTIDGDEIELELELKPTNSKTTSQSMTRLRMTRPRKTN